MTTETPIARPAIVTEAHLKYLDSLQKSGVTNMFGAAPYLTRAFSLDRKDSVTVLSYWMNSYGERHTN